MTENQETQDNTPEEEVALDSPLKISCDLIKNLEKKRNSKILVYVVSTREGTDFQIADDAVRIIFDHLNKLKIKKSEKLDLFIHSFGGVGTIPWKLVNLIREFTDDFEVIVPYKAYSAATLIALGANKIVMSPMAELGPIDPKVGNEFNPITPHGRPIGINVEDVASYISFIKDFAGISHEDELIQAINILASKVHPLALGNVHRFYSQSRMMAKKLMMLHMDTKEEHIIDDIVETLTSKLFFHGHPINRREAKEMQLKVEERIPKEIERMMWELYSVYEEEMEMCSPFIPKDILNSSGSDMEEVTLCGAIIESVEGKDIFSSQCRITRPNIPPNAPLPLQIQASTDAVVISLKNGWNIMEEESVV